MYSIYTIYTAPLRRFLHRIRSALQSSLVQGLSVFHSFLRRSHLHVIGCIAKPMANGLKKVELCCNVNDYLSVMKTLCIHLYRRTVETETMMNSIIYILE